MPLSCAPFRPPGESAWDTESEDGIEVASLDGWDWEVHGTEPHNLAINEIEHEEEEEESEEEESVVDDDDEAT